MELAGCGGTVPNCSGVPWDVRSSSSRSGVTSQRVPDRLFDEGEAVIRPPGFPRVASVESTAAWETFGVPELPPSRRPRHVAHPPPRSPRQRQGRQAIAARAPEPAPGHLELGGTPPRYASARPSKCLRTGCTGWGSLSNSWPDPPISTNRSPLHRHELPRPRGQPLVRVSLSAWRSRTIRPPGPDTGLRSVAPTGAVSVQSARLFGGLHRIRDRAGPGAGSSLVGGP